jgi:hypothetical protein
MPPHNTRKPTHAEPNENNDNVFAQPFVELQSSDFLNEIYKICGTDWMDQLKIYKSDNYFKPKTDGSKQIGRRLFWPTADLTDCGIVRWSFWSTVYLNINNIYDPKITKNNKTSSFLAICSIFEAEVRPSALKILKSLRTKVVSYECPQLFRLQFSSIFEFEIFLYKHKKSKYWHNNHF